MKFFWKVVLLAGIVALLAVILIFVLRPAKWVRGHIRFPEQVLLEDFQRPLDRDLTASLEQLYALPLCAGSQLGPSMDENVLKPLVDDPQSIGVASSAIQLTEGNSFGRADLLDIVRDCAKILGIPVPRIYVVTGAGLNAKTMNTADPMIVLDSTLLRRNPPASEWRFIIGHEMGHIKCRHVRWTMALDAARRTLPETVGTVALLPLLKWSREAEMSCDNAGLICCQDPRAAEHALMRRVSDLDNANLQRLDADAFINQRSSTNYSGVAEAVQLWREVATDHPFVPDRIRQLRKYAGTRQYQHLWED